MFYKPSMFNHICDMDSEIILYNPLSGCNGIRRVHADKVSELLELLKNFRLDKTSLNTFENLVELGYFVPFDFDERLNRERMQIEMITNTVLRLVIHTTKDCNFRCKYCALDFCNESMSQEICDSIIKYIRQNISRFSAVHISWFGGEPLMGINVIEYISTEVIEICKRAKKPYYSSITTNGYLLTPKNIFVLMKSKVSNYVVTIDGIRSTHDNQRVLMDGSGSFNRIIDNLKYISEKIVCRSLRVIIRTNITQDIYDVLEEYYNFYNLTFGHDKRFSLFVRPAGNWGGERVKRFLDHLIDESSMDSVMLDLAELDGDIKYGMNFADLNFGGTTCNATYLNKYTIGCGGLIAKCDTVSEDLAIGRLVDGRMVIDRDKENQWIFGHRCRDEECNNCYFGLSCFCNSCPKSRILYKSKSCGKINQIDSLLKLYCRTNDVEYV